MNFLIPSRNRHPSTGSAVEGSANSYMSIDSNFVIECMKEMARLSRNSPPGSPWLYSPENVNASPSLRALFIDSTTIESVEVSKVRIYKDLVAHILVYSSVPYEKDQIRKSRPLGWDAVRVVIASERGQDGAMLFAKVCDFEGNPLSYLKRIHTLYANLCQRLEIASGKGRTKEAYLEWLDRLYWTSRKDGSQPHDQASCVEEA